IISFSAGSTIVRASSGSRSRISSVEPLMSANSAVTVLRSPSGVPWPPAWAETPVDEARSGAFGGLSSLSDAPQLRQNFAAGPAGVRHEGQMVCNLAPHCSQKAASLEFSLPQPEQRILPPLARALRAQFIKQRLRVLQIDGVETLGEPAVDFCEHCARVVTMALLCEEPREAHRRAQLPCFGTLTPSYLDGCTKAGL